MSRSQDQTLLRNIAVRERAGRTLRWDQQIEARIQALTAEEITAAFRKRIAIRWCV